MAQFKVLLVEDHVDAYQLVQRALGTRVQLEWAKTQKEAAAALEKKDFDLILLDVMLPDGDGFHLCSILQAHEKWCNIPVIILSAKNTVPDKVLGFSVGADDFIAKPFDALELRARVDAKLRKRERDMVAADTIVFDDLEINKSTQRVSLNEEGRTSEIDLTPIEFKLLLFLANRANTVVTRDQILDTVWGESVHVYSRSVDTHISKLRRKLGTKGQYIQSAHGAGYRFATPVNTNRQINLDYSNASTLQYGRMG
jgi:two-component system, OmpR family, phosphate regulon response regulator PhoB